MRRLVVAEHHQHQVVVAVGARRTTTSASQRVLDRLRRTPRAPASGDAPDRRPATAACSGIPSKTEPSPTSAWSIRRGVRDHGAWLEIRSISAITGGAVRGASSSAVERVEGVLVGHRRVAEPRARGSRRCASRRAGRSRRTRPAASRGCWPARRRPCASRPARRPGSASAAGWSPARRSAAGCRPTARTAASRAPAS